MFPATDKPVDPTAAPALVVDMTMEEYQSRTDALSKSMISKMDCPKKFKYEFIDGNGQEEADHFNVGTAVHTLALEPKLFEARFHILPAKYINGKGEEATFRRDPRMQLYKDQIQLAKGRTILTAADYDDVKGMAASLVQDPTALALLKRPGLIEPSIFWTDPETGQRYKCRPDFLGDDDSLVVDIKKSNSAKPKDFFRQAFDLKYDLSVAHTSRGVKALRGKAPENYVFIVVEDKAPYTVEVYDAFRPFDEDEESMAPLSYYDAGAHRLDIYLARYRQCVLSGVWPGYNGGRVMPMTVPRYELKNLEKERA